MSNAVSLGNVTQLADQLSPPDRWKLLAYLCRQLRVAFPAAFVVEGDEHQARQVREAMADALLYELDAIAGSIEGEFEAADDIRQIRNQRAGRL